MRFAGAKAAGEQQPGRRRIAPELAETRLEPLLDRVLDTAEQPHRRLVGHSGAQRLEGGAQREAVGRDGAHDAAIRTRGASGLSPPCGRTSSHTRICKAVY